MVMSDPCGFSSSAVKVESGKFQLGHGAGSSAVTMTMDAMLDYSVESDAHGTAQ